MSTGTKAARGVNMQQLREAEAKKKAAKKSGTAPNQVKRSEEEAAKKAEKKEGVKLPDPPKSVLGSAGTNPPVKPPVGEPVKGWSPEAEKPEAKKPIVPPKPPELKAETTPLEPPKPEADKPQSEARATDFTGVISAPPNEKGEGAVGAGKKYRALVFGHPVTKIIRWCWSEGFAKVEIKKALEDMLDVSPRETTYGLQKSQLARGVNASLPELTDKQAEKLNSYKMVKVG